MTRPDTTPLDIPCERPSGLGTERWTPTKRREIPVRIMRTAAMLGIAKKVYDEARKPENQARIKSAVAKVQDRRKRR